MGLALSASSPDMAAMTLTVYARADHREVCHTGSKETNTMSSWAPVSCWSLCSCITDENRWAHGGGEEVAGSCFLSAEILSRCRDWVMHAFLLFLK